MKYLASFLVFIGITATITAQIPDGFSYQAVIRENSGTLVKNQTISVKSSILKNEEVIFTQTQTATTNENGLLTLTLGNAEFQDINWLDGPLFIKTEIDLTGGNNFTIETETQLLTVPYSMAAKTAETALNVPEMDLLIERINNLEAQVEELREYLFGESLLNTKWKLIGIFDTETDILMQVLEPQDCNECFTFEFNTVSTFKGQTTNNLILGTYEFDLNTRRINDLESQVEELRNYLYSDMPCPVANPLTDLPWLKNFIDQAVENIEAGSLEYHEIFIFTYRDGHCFSVISSTDPYTEYFINCDGYTLCVYQRWLGYGCINE